MRTHHNRKKKLVKLVGGGKLTSARRPRFGLFATINANAQKSLVHCGCPERGCV